MIKDSLIRIYLRLVNDRWSLGFIEEPLKSIVSGGSYKIHKVKGIPRDRWYADPFILDIKDDNIELLVEEWRYKNSRGRIARLVIDRHTYQLQEEHIVLDLDTHLSFPFIQRKGGEIYVSPENSMSGGWHQYKYDRLKDRLIRIKTIINEPLTDAICTELFGDDLVFSTVVQNSNGSLLNVYNGNGKKLNEILFPSNTARGAGGWFKIGNEIYRPAQNCNGAYGRSVIIQKVLKNKKGDFVFENINEICSNISKFRRGCHTFNFYNDLIVVDLYGYKHGILGPITDGLKLVVRSVLRVIRH